MTTKFNAKYFVLKYQKSELNWLDGELLKSAHNLTNDQLRNIDVAIFLFNILQKQFKNKNSESLINETSALLAERLERLA